MCAISITLTPATDPACLQLQDALSNYLQQLTGSSGRASFAASTLGERGFFLLARENAQAAGCVAVRELSAGIGEIKRMYACPGTRGVGAQLLCALEQHARERGFQALWLETRKINQRAVDFYQRNGFKIRENYGSYIGRLEAVCFEKAL